ncbi:MAG: hypothetical protein H6737_24565 [Alphaproteobacteria bacterium]|nr:hypothetical protein [Alphaproteobacteria bacterium]
MSWPLRDALQSWREGVDLPTALFGLAMAGLLVGTLGATAFPAAWLERGHMKHGFFVFAVTQPIPFMYTGEHRYTRTSDEALSADVIDVCAQSATGFRQHVPVSVLTAPLTRWMQASCGLPAEVAIDSVMRGHATHSTWRLSRRDGVVWIEPGDAP